MTPPPPFARRAVTAAVVSTAIGSSGCTRTVVVPSRELPRLVAAQAEGSADLEVVDVDGVETTIDAPVAEISIVPVGTLVFMQPPGVARGLPVAPRERDARAADGWREVDLSLRRPFAATADSQSLTLTQLPRAGSALTPPREARVPILYVEGVEVEEVDVPATVGAALGITAGVTALAFGTALAVLVSSKGFGM